MVNCQHHIFLIIFAVEVQVQTAASVLFESKERALQSAADAADAFLLVYPCSVEHRILNDKSVLFPVNFPVCAFLNPAEHFLYRESFNSAQTIVSADNLLPAHKLK